jgi:hypothetical protein
MRGGGCVSTSCFGAISARPSAFQLFQHKSSDFRISPGKSSVLIFLCEYSRGICRTAARVRRKFPPATNRGPEARSAKMGQDRPTRPLDAGSRGLLTCRHPNR